MWFYQLDCTNPSLNQNYPSFFFNFATTNVCKDSMKIKPSLKCSLVNFKNLCNAMYACFNDDKLRPVKSFLMRLFCATINRFFWVRFPKYLILVFMACPLRSWARIKTASVKWVTDFKLSPHLGCFDIVFQRSYRDFSIALTVILALSDRYEILTND